LLLLLNPISYKTYTSENKTTNTVTYVNSFDEINSREYRSLLEGYEIFKERNPKLIIITWDYKDKKNILVLKKV